MEVKSPGRLGWPPAEDFFGACRVQPIASKGGCFDFKSEQIWLGHMILLQVPALVAAAFQAPFKAGIMCRVQLAS